MGVDAGTVYSEIRISLDKLQGDINKVDKLFLETGTMIDKIKPEIRLKTDKLKIDIQNAEILLQKLKKQSESEGMTPELRLKMDKVQNDINRYNLEIQKLKKQTTQTVQDSTNAFNQMSKNGVNSFGKMVTGIGAAFKALPIIGAITLVTGTVAKLAQGIGNFLKEGAAAYQAHQKELAKMNSVLNSTGAAAWTSTIQLAEHARGLADNTQFAQNEIMKMQSVLLGFRSITGQVFKDATEAIVNMASVMGGDLTGAANTFGKALDTPNEGLGALSRNGFVFTQTQKEMINALVESGDKLSAQKIIIDEMHNAFGGAAVAIGDVVSEQSRLANATERLKRAQGEATSGFTKWWTGWRANMREARASQAEFNNAVNVAKNSDYSKQINELERLRAKLSDVADKGDRLRLSLQIEKLELELDFTQANNQLILARKNLEDYKTATQTTGNVDKEHLQYLNDVVTVQQKIVEGIEHRIEKQGESAGLQLSELENQINELEKIDALRKEGIDNEKELSAITQTRVNTEAEARRLQAAGLITIEEMNQRIASAYQQEANAVNTLITRVSALKVTSDVAIKAQNDLLQSLNNNLTLASNNYADLYEQIKKGGERITAADWRKQIDSILQIRDVAIRAIDEMLADETISQDRREDLLKRRAQSEQSAASSLQSLWEAHEVTLRKNPIQWQRTKDAIDSAIGSQANYNQKLKEQQEIQKLIDATKKAEEKAGITLREQELEYQLTLAKRAGNLDEIKRIEKEIAMFQLEQDENFKNALVGTQEQLVESQERLKRAAAGNELLNMLEDYQKKTYQINASTKQMYETQRVEALKTAQAFRGMDGYDKLIININKYYDVLQKKEAWDKFAQNAQSAISQTLQLFNAISAAVLAFQKRDLDAYIADLDERNEKLQEALDEELQQMLFAAGLSKASTTEQHDAELEKAIATGNHRLIYEAQQAKKRYEIEKEINDKKKAAEDQLEKDKAKREHEYAMNQWRIQLATGAANLAQAIMVAAASAPWPYNLVPMSFASGVGAAQITAITAAKPPAPKFDTGGIVRGDPYRGDAQPIMARGREMVLTDQDQTALFDMIRAGSNGQPVVINTVIELDSDVIASAVFRSGSNGQNFIRARGVVR